METPFLKYGRWSIGTHRCLPAPGSRPARDEPLRVLLAGVRRPYHVLMDKLTIRLATASDLESAIEVLEERTEKAHLVAGRWIEAGALRVADSGGHVVGIAVTEPTFFKNDFVEMLRVVPTARRRGVAQALLQAAGAERSTEKLFTSTNLSNWPMQGLLRLLGWESVGMVYGLDEGDLELFYRAPAR